MIEVLATGYQLAEAPRVDHEGRVYFSDALGGGVYRWSSEGGVETIVPKRRGVGGMALHADGGVVVGGRSVVHVAPDGTNRDVWVLPDGVVGINDLCALADGSLLVGSLRFLPFTGDDPVPGGFWHVTAAGEAVEALDDVEWSNGCGSDGDRWYCCDYNRGVVHVLAGEHHDRRESWTLPDGEADGLAVDDEHGVWVAQPRSRRLLRLTPSGEVERTVDVGAAVTSLAFDGATMYLTTLADGTGEGALLRMDAPVPGPRHHFATI